VHLRLRLDIYTCRTTDFTCSTARRCTRTPPLAGQGKTAQQIIDEFVKQYGEVALMAPPKKVSISPATCFPVSRLLSPASSCCDAAPLDA